MKKSLRVCTREGPYDWILQLARDWQDAKAGTGVKYARELKGHASCCTIGQNIQSGQVVSSRLKLKTRSNREPELSECPV